MKHYAIRMLLLFGIGLFPSFGGCREAITLPSPPGYDLAAPATFVLSESLREISAYVLQYRAGHALAITDHFKVEIPANGLTSIHKNIKFHPSCLARHPLTKQWYILSSVNKALIVPDDRSQVKGIYSWIRSCS